MSIKHGENTIDGNPRLDCDPRTAILNRRLSGYIVDIAHPTDDLTCEHGEVSKKTSGRNALTFEKVTTSKADARY